MIISIQFNLENAIFNDLGNFGLFCGNFPPCLGILIQKSESTDNLGGLVDVELPEGALHAEEVGVKLGPARPLALLRPEPAGLHEPVPTLADLFLPVL